MFKFILILWVGFWKINVFYWCWEDMFLFINSLLQWMLFEFSDVGFCGILLEFSIWGLKVVICINLFNGSVCERFVNYSVKQCWILCVLRIVCGDCISGSFECMWCSNMKQCVDFNVYVVFFFFWLVYGMVYDEYLFF